MASGKVDSKKCDLSSGTPVHTMNAGRMSYTLPRNMLMNANVTGNSSTGNAVLYIDAVSFMNPGRIVMFLPAGTVVKTRQDQNWGSYDISFYG